MSTNEATPKIISTRGNAGLVVQSAVRGWGAPGRRRGGPSTNAIEQPEYKAAPTAIARNRLNIISFLAVA